MEIIKRDGRIVPYDRDKIQEAVFKAAYKGQVNNGYLNYHSDPVKANRLANTVAKIVDKDLQGKEKVSIDEIQNHVVKTLNVIAKPVSQAYLTYKTEKQIERGL